MQLYRLRFGEVWSHRPSKRKPKDLHETTSVLELPNSSQKIIEDSLAHTTKKKYGGLLADVNIMSKALGVPLLPMSTLDQVRVFFTRLEGRTPETILSYRRAITAEHDFRGWARPPFDHPTAVRLFDGLKNRGQSVKKEYRISDPLPEDVYRKLMERWGRHQSYASRRNKCISALLWCTCCRYSEVASMLRSQLKPILDVKGEIVGYEWELPTSKTSREPYVFTIIGPAAMELKAFLAIAPNNGGYIFRPIKSHLICRGLNEWKEPKSSVPPLSLKEGGKPDFSVDAFNGMLREAVKDVSADDKVYRFTSHSFRKGRATQMYFDGVSTEEIGSQLRHASERTLGYYIPLTAADKARIKKRGGTALMGGAVLKLRTSAMTRY